MVALGGIVEQGERIRLTGRQILQLRLIALKEEVQNYYGALAELEEGINREPPIKPEALLLYEQCVDMNLPLVAGGVLDQPHIWVYEYGICKQVKDLNMRLKAESLERKG